MRQLPAMMLVLLLALPAAGQAPLPKLPMDEPGWDDDGPVGGFAGAPAPAPEDAPEPPAPPPGPEATSGGPAVPDTSLDRSFKKLAVVRHKEALRHFEAHDYPRALAALRAAYDLDSQDPEIVNDLAYLLHTLGNRDDAMKYYREALTLSPNRYTAHINLADLLMEGDEDETAMAEAAHLLMRARELSGNKPSVILRQARAAARRGHFDEARLFYKEVEVRTELSDRRLLELGDFYRDFGRTDLASDYYRRIQTDGAFAQEAARRLDHLEVSRTARRYGWASSLKPVPVAARALLARARLFLAQHRLNEGRGLLEEALAMAPHFAEARMYLGDALKGQGDLSGAELAYLRALALDSANADVHLRLGELYLGDDERNRSAEAVLFLHNALQLHPDWTAVRLRLAQACQASGELAAAREEVLRYLDEAAPDAPDRAQAEVLAQALDSVMAGGTTEALPYTTDPALEAPVQAGLNRARSYLAQDRPDAAMAELLRLAETRDHPAILNLEARILVATDRLSQAQDRLQESLALNPEQPDTWELAGLVLERLSRPEEANQAYQRASQLGSASARLQLLRLALHAGVPWPKRALELVQPHHLWRLHQELSELVMAHEDTPVGKQATILLAEAGERLRMVLLAYLLCGALLLVAAAFWWRRRYAGTDLSTLVQRYPEAGPEVQRVLAAIRHEVLKHNTMVLAGLVQKLEAGLDASGEAQRLRDTLFGNQGEEAVLGHLLNYCTQLQQIGRTHGVRLNLHHRDPALSAILRGFAILEGYAGRLERVEFMTPRQRHHLVKRLKEAGQCLNVQGYEAVRTLLDTLRALVVSPPLLEGVFQRITREPKMAELDIVPAALDLDAPLPLAILVPRGAFEDILGNLVRNALIASAESGIAPLQIGLAVGLEVDPITGFETALFSVRDRATQPLTTEMIRGRYIEGGLGLSSDLVARYEGSIDVSPGPPGWQKSVTFRFPVATSTGDAP
jgi:Flp pilus assembly protein TadD